MKMISDLNEKEIKKILRERAKKIARKKEEAIHLDEIEVLEFFLSSETYAFETRFVKEVIQLKEVTPLPLTPNFMLGIINVRGALVSVIDLRKFFEIPANALSNLNRVILLQEGEIVVGVLADSIGGVWNIDKESITKTLPTLKGIREDFLLGITPERMVIIDTQKLLGDPKLIINDEI